MIEIRGFIFKITAFRALLTAFVLAGGAVMIGYLALKVFDLAMRSQFALLFGGSLESKFFLAEILLGLILPILIVFSHHGKTRGGLLLYGILTCGGLIMNRMNTVFTSMYGHLNSVYIPSVWEFAVTVAILSMAVLLYCFLVDNFNVLKRNGQLSFEKDPMGKGAAEHTSSQINSL